MRHLLPTLLVSTLASGLLTGLDSPAIASVYDNTIGENQFGDQSHLILVENQSPGDPIPQGFGNKVFLQTPDGPLWTTDLTITQSNSGTGGNRIYTGTFSQDTTVETCTGDVTLTRSRTGRDTIRHLITMTRKFTGGYNCSQVGQTDTWGFRETVPEEGDRIEYNANNADRWINLDNRNSTWIKWQLQRGISQLNCRATPNGRITKVFQSSDVINVPTDVTLAGKSAFRAAGQSSWLLTDQNCYVRANSRYIRPVAMPR
jgi:hypothetical protein